MRRGRPPVGLGHVERLRGPKSSKHRLYVLLSSLLELMTVEEACRELGVGEARFHVLRQQMLEGALEAILPRRRGRPRLPEPSPAQRRVEELEDEVTRLKLDLYGAEIREMLRLTMPQVLDRGAGRKPAKKKSREPWKKQ